jgi:hypothetical protein
MATETTQTQVLIPEYIEKPTEKMANTLDQLMQQQFNVPQQQVAGFSPTQQAAMQQAYGGIGAYQPYLTSGNWCTGRGSWNNRSRCTSIRTNAILIQQERKLLWIHINNQLHKKH